jgi:GAF domain-containing protein
LETALEQARQRIEELTAQAARFELIHRVGQALIEAPDLDTAMGRVVEMVATHLGYSRTAVLLRDLDLDELELVSAFGYGELHGLRIPLSQGATGFAVRRNETVNIPDVTSDPRYVRGVTRGRSELAVPIRLDGAVIGAIDIESTEPGAFGPADVEVVEHVAFYAAAAINAWRMRQEAEVRARTLDDRTRRLDLLHRVSRSLTGRLSLDELLDELLRLCAEAFDLRNVAILLLDEGDPALVLRAEIGYAESAPRRLRLDEGITGHVAATGVPVLIPDVAKDPRYVTGVSGGRAEMAAPLKVGGRVLGVLDAESAVVGGFGEDDLDLFTSFAAQAAIAIRAAELQGRLEGGGGGS